MPSPQSQTRTHSSYGSIVEPCKLALILPLVLVTLPSLFFSLVTFSILAFFLLLPIAIALLIIYLLSSILSRDRYPINNSYDDEFFVVCAPKDIPVEYQKQESFELDGLEVPRLDDSSSSSSSVDSAEEQEKIIKELEEMSHEEFCQFIERFESVQTDGFMSFYEVLSFWRSKESPAK